MRDRAPSPAHRSGDRHQERSLPGEWRGGYLRPYVRRVGIASALSWLGACCSTEHGPLDLQTPEATVRSFQEAFEREDGPGVYATLHPEYRASLGLASDTAQLALERLLEQEPLSARLASGDIESVEIPPTRHAARVLVVVSWLWIEERVEFLLRRDTIVEARGVDLVIGGPEKVIGDEVVRGAPQPRDVVRVHSRDPRFLVIEVDPARGVSSVLRDPDYELRSLRVGEVWRIVNLRLSSSAAAEGAPEETPEPE